MLSRIVHMLSLGLVLLAWSPDPVAAQSDAPRFELKVERADHSAGGKAYRITSSAAVTAMPAAVWRTLTDYEHLPDYLPNLKSVRVVSRDGNSVILEQFGSAQFLFFRQAIRLLVQVDERAPDRIDISLIDGDMKIYRASWELTPMADAAGTRLLYNATIMPKFDVPGIVGTGVVRRDVGRMMAAMLARLEQPK